MTTLRRPARSPAAPPRVDRRALRVRAVPPAERPATLTPVVEPQDPSRSEKVSEVVAQQIVDNIVARQLSPGDRLPAESLMLKIYRVSRASLREALRILEVNGLISIRPGPGGGPVVRGVSTRDFGRMAALYFEMRHATVAEVVAARLVIEPVMARLAAELREPSNMAALSRFLETARTAPLDSDASYAANITEFHDIVLRSSGNRVLDIYGGALKHLLTDRVVGHAFTGAMALRARADHEAIGAAILKGDRKNAERLMRKHMESFQQNYVDRYPTLMTEIVSWHV